VGVNELLKELCEKYPGASDIILKPDEVAVISSKEVIEKRRGDFSELVEEVVFSLPDRSSDVDTSWKAGDLRFRLNVAKYGGRNYCCTFRWLKPVIWKLSDYMIEESIIEKVFSRIRAKKGGLVLVIGPTGSGKSSVMAAFLNQLLEEMPVNVVTIEDPVEYHLNEGKGLVLQREVGTDTPSFARGLKSALRENPNIIFVGEVRDEETVDLLTQAADTGHVCFATLHTSSAKDTMERLMGMLPPEKQQFTLQVLARNLIGVLGLRMFDVGGRKVLVHEFLNAEDPTVKSLILKAQFSQISTYMNNIDKGHVPFEFTVAKLVKSGLIPEDKVQELGYDKSRVMMYKARLK